VSDDISNVTTQHEINNQTPPAPILDAKVSDPTKLETQPDKLGSQFAALSRKEKAIKAREAEISAKAEQVKQLEQRWSSFENLSAEEIIEQVASRRGTTPEELIKGHISRITGQPSAEQALKESKDPAVQALAAKLEEQSKANKELQKQLQEKAEAEQLAKQSANVALVQNECLQSASTNWSDESDYPLFFTDQGDLARNVFQYCAQRVNEYQRENGFAPEDSDIAKLIKAAPEVLLQEHLQSPRGQRIAGLKASQVAAAKATTAIVRKPKLNVPLVSHTTNGVETQKPILRTKDDRSARLARASAAMDARERS
jgi:hypothetical protein